MEGNGMDIKRIMVLALIMVNLLGTTGCSDNRGVTASAPPGKELITVTDCVGRVVQVPRNPDRVACLFAVSTHMLAILGDSHKIVAVSEGNMRDYMFLHIFPEVENARTPKGSGNFNIEELFKDPAPEIVFCYTDIVQDPKMMEKMEIFGVPVVVINFTTVAEQQYTMKLLGQIMGKEQQAQAYNDYYQEVLQLVEGRVAGIPEENKKVVYHAVNELLRTDTSNSLPADWLPRTGIKNVGVGPEEKAGGKNFLTLEQFFMLDPEYMIINGSDVIQYIEANEKMHNLAAYQKGNLKLMPLGVSRWGHPYSVETPLAILWTAKTIYPEMFPDVDLNQETRTFYQRFFHYQLSDTEVEKIMEGKEYKKIVGGVDANR